MNRFRLPALASLASTAWLLAGAGHVDPALGVRLHLPANANARPVMLPPQPSAKDHCEELRKKMERK